MIPNILYFTYKTNLLTDPVDTKDRTLASNIKHIENTVPNASIRFLTDRDCIHTIKKLPKQLQRNLLPVFKKEVRGMIRGDICRGAALYQTGGWYIDVDVEVTRDFRLLAKRMQHETLLTVIPAWQPATSYFQAIMGVRSPRDRTIRKYLWMFVNHTQQNRNENTGTLLLHEAVLATKAHVYELYESRGPLTFQGKRSRFTGKGYWCDNVVYDKHYGDLWFYSRVQGSRMC
jgi:hypothetical protein